MTNNDKLWDKSETLLLAKYCIDIHNKKIGRQDAILELSNVLREYGKKKKLVIDAKYRNENGISWQLAIMEKLLFKYYEGMEHSSFLFEEVAKDYRENKRKFDEELSLALETIKRPKSSGWKEDIYNVVKKLNKESFSLKDVYSFEEELKTIHPNNSNIKEKIRQQLQFLRNDGVIEFEGNGDYKLTNISENNISSISKLFQLALNSYLKDTSKKTDSNSLIHNLFIREIPDLLSEKIGRNDIEIKGSIGQGNKAVYPWIAIFNNKITRSAQNGIYIVYLFKSDMSGFYLTLSQGMTYFEETYKKERYNYIEEVAKYIRNELKDISSINTFETKLNSQKNDTGYGYEKSVIFSRYYASEKFGDNDMINDLTEMIDIYDLLIDYFSGSSYEEVILNAINDKNNYKVSSEEAIEQLEKSINPENIISNEKKVLEEVIPTPRDKKIFRELSIGGRKKIDYINRTRRDLKNGERGELLVLEFERNRLKDLGLSDYSNLVQWISIEDDSFGYDIESVDVLDDGTIVPIYIEVKTTSHNVDTDFFVSKHELEVSKKLKDHYYIYRIYNVENEPKFYRAQGYIEDNFLLDPVTYSARYKYKD